MAGGAAGQLGIASEVTPGTIVTPTKFFPIRSENIKQNIEYIDTQTISARHTVRLTRKSTTSIEGGFTTELANTTIATLLKHMFGAVNTTGAGPYVHVYTPGTLTGKSMTVQVGRPASDDTVHAFSYSGAKVASWSIGASVGEFATLEVGLIGMGETTATALAVASYDAAWAPFTFREAAVSVAGSTVAEVRDFTLSGTNAVENRHRLGSATSLQPLQIGLRDYSGSLTADFTSLSLYQLYTAGTEASLVITFDNAPSGGAQTLVFDLNVQFTGETPELSGFELLAQTLPFRAVSSTSDADAITVTLSNSEAAA